MTISLVDTSLAVTIVNEEDLTWQEHNKIHKALNKAYMHRTRAFLKKTYSYEEPIKRILIMQADEIVGHTALFDTAVIMNEEQIKVAGIGMTLSLKPFHRLGFQLRKKTILLAQQLNYPLLLSRATLSLRAKNELSPFAKEFLDIPMIGKTTMSHSWEMITVYNTKINTPLVNKLITYFKKEQKIILTTEIF